MAFLSTMLEVHLKDIHQGPSCLGVLEALPGCPLTWLCAHVRLLFSAWSASSCLAQARWLWLKW